MRSDYEGMPGHRFWECWVPEQMEAVRQESAGAEEVCQRDGSIHALGRESLGIRDFHGTPQKRVLCYKMGSQNLGGKRLKECSL